MKENEEIKQMLETVIVNQQKILKKLETGNEQQPLGDYVTETEARKLLSRKTTWFWQMRISGVLAFTKIGSRIYYARQDILQLLDRNKTKGTGIHPAFATR